MWTQPKSEKWKALTSQLASWMTWSLSCRPSQKKDLSGWPRQAQAFLLQNSTGQRLGFQRCWCLGTRRGVDMTWFQLLVPLAWGRLHQTLQNLQWRPCRVSFPRYQFHRATACPQTALLHLKWRKLGAEQLPTDKLHASPETPEHLQATGPVQWLGRSMNVGNHLLCTPVLRLHGCLGLGVGGSLVPVVSFLAIRATHSTSRSNSPPYSTKLEQVNEKRSLTGVYLTISSCPAPSMLSATHANFHRPFNLPNS